MTQQHTTATDRQLNLDFGNLNLGNGYYTITIRQGDKVTTKTLVVAH